MKLAIKVVPGAAQDEIAGWLGEALKVRVSAPAEKGKANAAVERAIAQALNLPLENVQIVKGHTSPRKTVEIQGLSAAEVNQKLAELGFS